MWQWKSFFNEDRIARESFGLMDIVQDLAFAHEWIRWTCTNLFQKDNWRSTYVARVFCLLLNQNLKEMLLYIIAMWILLRSKYSFFLNWIFLMLATLQTHHVYSTLKRRGNECFHVISMWNTRGVFVGKKIDLSNNFGFPKCLKQLFSVERIERLVL